MSHFSSIRTTLADRELLLITLRSLGYTPEEGCVFARGFAGTLTGVEFRVPVRDGYDIGFRKSEVAYEVVADWRMAGVNQEAFIQSLTQRYAYHATRAKLEQQGFVLSSEDLGEDGSVHLVLRRTR